MSEHTPRTARGAQPTLTEHTEPIAHEAHAEHGSRARAIGTRWLGVGLASVIAVVTLGLAATGRLGLYINPDSTWFAVTMSVLVLVGAVASFTLPLGAEEDHGHDHGDERIGDPGHDRSRDRFRERGHDLASTAESAEGEARRQRAEGVSSRSARSTTGGEGAPVVGGGDDARVVAGGEGARVGGAHARTRLGAVATVAGGVAASGIVALTLVLPPASLSAELAMSRDVGAPPLFAGQDVVTLATTGDTDSFGVGEWSSVFATTTNPEAFDGDPVVLTGFVTPADADADATGFDLSRLVITHCVIDAQPASVPVLEAEIPDTGQWVTITGTVRSSSDGRLAVVASSVEQIDEPEDPYEY